MSVEFSIEGKLKKIVENWVALNGAKGVKENMCRIKISAGNHMRVGIWIQVKKLLISN